MKNKELKETYSEQELVCPYCDYEFRDSFEFSENSAGDLGLIECPDCGKEFWGYREVSISYSGVEATYDTCELCGKENVVIDDGWLNWRGEKVGVHCCLEEHRWAVAKAEQEKYHQELLTGRHPKGTGN